MIIIISKYKIYCILYLPLRQGLEQILPKIYLQTSYSHEKFVRTWAAVRSIRTIDRNKLISLKYAVKRQYGLIHKDHQQQTV